MRHFPPTLFINSARWAQHPPTGVALAAALSSAFNEDEFLAELVELTGRSEAYVGWHLALESVIPACLLAAALRLRGLRLSQSVRVRKVR